jgi:hypothetical protein
MLRVATMAACVLASFGPCVEAFAVSPAAITVRRVRLPGARRAGALRWVYS